jgi:glycosyltransferase involved in cell wall biosynthesis
MIPLQNAPKISVIIPAYNVQEQIGACIASLIGQTFTDFQAIVVDDGSSDATPARLFDAIGTDPRFVVIRQGNLGLSAARNAGLDLASGTFIAFLDGDDRYDLSFLERMYAALSRSKADWVACGLLNVHRDGHNSAHSAIHKAPELSVTGPRLWPLRSWEEVIAHFPSSWNKLYRRSLLEGLRFDEGTWFEDHAFFCRVAARSDTLLHLPEPLYLQTRDRPGQITATESDRIFEQLNVLSTLKEIFDGSHKPGGDAALGLLAHRLFHERSTVLRSPDRRARFIAAAQKWLAHHNLPAIPDPTLPPSWALELADTCPISVVIPWDGQDAQLRITLASLAAQTQRGAEFLIVADDTATAARGALLAAESGLPGAQGLCARSSGSPGNARNTGLSAAQGEMIVFLDAGDQLRPAALSHWTDSMLREKADFGISQFRIGLNEGNVHNGFHDTTLVHPIPDTTGPLPLSPDQAITLHCHPTAKIFRRCFLDQNGLRFGTGALAPWQIVIGAAVAAQKTLYFAWPGAESSEEPKARRIWTAPVSASSLIQALDEAADSWPHSLCTRLPPYWQRRLYARALWEVAHFAPMSFIARQHFCLVAFYTIYQRGWRQMQGPFDPYISRNIRRLMNDLSPQEAASQIAWNNADGP